MHHLSIGKAQRSSTQIQLAALFPQKVQPQYARILHLCHPYSVCYVPPPHSQLQPPPAFHRC